MDQRGHEYRVFVSRPMEGWSTLDEIRIGLRIGKSLDDPGRESRDHDSEAIILKEYFGCAGRRERRNEMR